MSSGSLKNVIYKMCLEIMYLIYMYKKDLALNNQQWSICHKAKPKQYCSLICSIFLEMFYLVFAIFKNILSKET